MLEQARIIVYSRAFITLFAMPEPFLTAQSPLGIIAGNGQLPLQLAQACVARQRPVFILGFDGTTDMTFFAHMPHASVRIGAVGEALERLRAADVKQLVMAGGMKRPSFTSLKPDAKGVKLLTRLGKSFFGGDDALLRQVIGFLEEEGFSIVGVQDILIDIPAPAGSLGAAAPDARQLQDIALGLEAARALGREDAGQAVIVDRGEVLDREDAEGTAALIRRHGARAKSPSPSGILVKARKPSQENRADLPAIGPDTVEQAHAAGLAGIAVEAGHALIIHRGDTLAAADRYGIFIYGI